ncbi:MAG: hypothetical protein KDD83_09850, partial [Caldilineaceae bacterium]|nr:hypothetical protein [Caldilineaceae bacterium]
IDADGTHVDLAWGATDADDDPLTVTVFYSADDGATWRVLAQGLQAQDNVRLSTDNLPAGRQARLRVLVHDGFHSTTATSAAFAVAEHPPVPIIDGIVDGARVSFADAPIVLGFAYDPDEGSLDAEALAWILDGPTSRAGDGDQFDLRQLVPGAYTLTLTATDSTGLTAQTSVRFDILSLAVQDAPEPVLDGLCLDEGYADAVKVEFPRGHLAMEEGRWPYVRLLHAGGSLYVCFNDQGFADGRRPRLVGFQVDADGNSGDDPQGDDIGFFVDENGLGTQTSPFLGVMAPSPSPAAGFEVAVYPSVTIWSAEFRIDDALVGGWEHGARLLFKHEIADLYNDEANWPGTGRHSVPDTWAEAYFGTPPVPPNQPPIANAGSDVQIQVTEPMTLYLSGGLSYDPDNDRLRYRWRQVGGPTVRLDDPDGENVSFSVEPVREVTDLHFELIVNDGEVDSPPDAFMWRLLPADDTMPENYAVYLPFLMRQR